jgi:hypothetical protein
MSKITVTRKSSRKSSRKPYRIRNWSDYNESLVQRGSVTLWISTDMAPSWKPEIQHRQGGQFDYSDVAIECLLMLRSVFHLPLRATEGFALSLVRLMRLPIAIPDYSTLSRRAQTITVKLPKKRSGSLHAVLDSTGLKVFGEGEWKVRQHGYSKRRTWRKLHIATDPTSKEIQAVVLTENSVDDASVVPALLEQIERPIECLNADGSYDKAKVYTECKRRQIEHVAIPPQHNARIWQHGNLKAPPHPRDENLRRIRAIGRTQWKIETRYHQRSLGENTFFRFKTIFGEKVQARLLSTQLTEVRIKSAILNRMTQLGMPDSYRIA